MKISVISFTKLGFHLAKKLEEKFEAGQIEIYTKCSFCRESEDRYVEESLSVWSGKELEKGNALLFIGACGIAVRAVSPWIKNKLEDSPVLVMDEMGRFVIPLLAGHVGGANALAEKIAGTMGAVAVITTATDLRKKFAVDLFAKKNHLFLNEKEGIAKVSSKVLAGETITVSIENGHFVQNGGGLPQEVRVVPYPPEAPVDVLVDRERAGQCLLHLLPKEYVIGMGCRKGKAAEEIRAWIEKVLQEEKIAKEQIYALASIDVKKEEPGLVNWSRRERIPFFTYSAEELQDVEGEFAHSEFVKKQVGVDNVCERAALKACGKGTLVLKKQAEQGMTIAIAKREWRVAFDEE